ncbi:MAG: DUF86 domain-containing protein [Bacteroidales bacterium]|nr:DUF86 domain-containing protein [Bacteroidales bacterium]MCR4812760.1 DUF86 domain-containing protein [Bacteroidales bacterium]
MREQSRDIERLRHIVGSITHIEDFLRGKTLEQMKADVMCYHAVVYNIMVIGEAANLLTKEFRESHSEIPWRQIIDMRNVLVHGYYNTSPLFVWETYTNDLPILKQQVEKYITDLQ